MAKGGFTVGVDTKPILNTFKLLGGTDPAFASIVETRAIDAWGEAVIAAPVDEGTLQQSLGVEPTSDRRTAYRLTTTVFYAPYVEFGTGEKVFENDRGVEFSEGIKEYAKEFKGQRKIKGQKAQPFFYPAALKAQAAIVEDAKTFIKFQLDKRKKSR